MATIPRAALDRYACALDRAADGAGDAARRAVERAMARMPNASVAALRDVAVQAVADAVVSYGGAASALACELFYEVMALEGVAAAPAVPWGGPDGDAVSRGVHYQAGKLAAGDREGFLDGVSDLASYHARGAANHTMAASVGRAGNRIRYARVPRGAETCTYCMMLASRGFVYRTEKSAGHANHRGCNCVLVPGIKGKTEVGGYDQNACKRLWRKFEAIDAEKGKSDRAKRAAKTLEIYGEQDKEIRGLLRRYRADPRPDAWESLIGGYIRGATASGRVTAEPGASLSAKELHCADLLGANGHDVRFKARVEGYKVKSPDIDIDGDGPWDIKTIQSENPSKVFEAIKRSNLRGQSDRFVIDLSLGTIDMDDAERMARRAIEYERLNVSQVILIDQNGHEMAIG